MDETGKAGREVMDYPIFVIPLNAENGGGYFAYAPDLMGCMSDGETPEEALHNGQEAVREWIETAHRRGMTVPLPGSSATREREQKDQLLDQLKTLASNVDHFETRLQEVERMIREIEEQNEHRDSWSRFAEIAGLDEDGEHTNPPSAHC